MRPRGVKAVRDTTREASAHPVVSYGKDFGRAVFRGVAGVDFDDRIFIFR